MSYLLFVRSGDDLLRACGEVSEFFAFQRRQWPSASRVVHGVWIDPATVSDLPRALTPHTCTTPGNRLRVDETFGVAGIWQLARMQSTSEVSAVQQSTDQIIQSLRERPGSSWVGAFAPVFSRATTPSGMQAEMTRLRRRYREGVASPLVQDPVSAALELLEDRNL